MTDPKPAAPEKLGTAASILVGTTVLFGWPALLAINILLWKLAISL